ncbi:MAG TPA: LUD domain-containing protein [Dehalococcoidales bacterium]
MSRGMRKRLHQALTDQNLQTALQRRRLMGRPFKHLAAARAPDFELLSREIHRVKEEAMANLPQLIAQFKAEAAKSGAHIFEAKDARLANDYVLNLAQQHNVRHIVKSKSMMTEEIELREHLEKHGIEVKETDIGEWIVQLAGERPAHIVGPAMHKTVEQIAELFSRATGQKLEPDPQVLLNASRQALRQSYIAADMGISGANIAIAETGTITVLTNEGNGCMSTTLPPLHVAVVGYEKIVSSWEDAMAIIRLLSRSTMAMKMPVYISYITGPSRTSAIPGAAQLGGLGSTEVHIVLVDNGRMVMRESADFTEALYCLRCGACLNICPVFGSVAGQTYGYIYQGGIGTILTAFLHGMDKAEDLASLCLGCMACQQVCPARIDIPRLIKRLKAELVAKKGLPLSRRVAYGNILKHPGRLDRAVKLGSYLQRPFVSKDTMIRKLPYPLNSLTETISLPALPANSLKTRLKDRSSPNSGTKPRVAFYAGCVAEYAYPDLGEDVMKVLREYGAEPYYPAGQACCGAPALYAGDVKTAISLARTNITALEEGEPDYVVTVCPGCAMLLQKEYPELLANKLGWSERANRLASKVRDFSQLILELTPAGEKKPQLNKKVTYHDPCHLKRGLGVQSEPRQLLVREGFELVEMFDADVCCGFGGQVVLDYPELSKSILKRKLDEIEATGVDTVVTNCVACVLQLRGGLDKRQSKIKVVHSAELLAEPAKSGG